MGRCSSKLPMDWKQLALAGVMKQSPGFSPQPVDQVLQIDGPGTGSMAAAAVKQEELADQVGAKVNDPLVMVLPYRDLTAIQALRAGVRRGGRAAHRNPLS